MDTKELYEHWFDELIAEDSALTRKDLLYQNVSRLGVLWITESSGFKFYPNKRLMED